MNHTFLHPDNDHDETPVAPAPSPAMAALLARADELRTAMEEAGTTAQGAQAAADDAREKRAAILRTLPLAGGNGALDKADAALALAEKTAARAGERLAALDGELAATVAEIDRQHERERLDRLRAAGDRRTRAAEMVDRALDGLTIAVRAFLEADRGVRDVSPVLNTHLGDPGKAIEEQTRSALFLSGVHQSGHLINLHQREERSFVATVGDADVMLATERHWRGAAA